MALGVQPQGQIGGRTGTRSCEHAGRPAGDNCLAWWPAALLPQLTLGLGWGNGGPPFPGWGV